MASNLFARVIGTAFGEITNRKGTAKETGRPYDFNVLKVLVPDGGISEVVLPDESARLFGGALPVDGDPVDLLVEISARAKGFGSTIIKNYAYELASA